MTDSSSDPSSLLRSFVFERILNEDTRTKTITLLGTISSLPSILIAEKTAFSLDVPSLTTLPTSLSLTPLESNDIYTWFLASSISTTESALTPASATHKLTLIHPCTPTHILKHTTQPFRLVIETPTIYRTKVVPYITTQTTPQRLGWIYNILSHEKEAEKIIYENPDPDEGFVVLPDLKWDGKTGAALYCMALVKRKEVKSLRDLKKKHVEWLKQMRREILKAVPAKFGIEEDQLRIYVHYQPSYYHFHLHIVSLTHDAGGGMASGKALLLGNIISQLETMAGDDDAGFADIDIEYVIGEQSELWQTVFAPLKAEKEGEGSEDGRDGDSEEEEEEMDEEEQALLIELKKTEIAVMKKHLELTMKDMEMLDLVRVAGDEEWDLEGVRKEVEAERSEAGEVGDKKGECEGEKGEIAEQERESRDEKKLRWEKEKMEIENEKLELELKKLELETRLLKFRSETLDREIKGMA